MKTHAFLVNLPKITFACFTNLMFSFEDSLKKTWLNHFSAVWAAAEACEGAFFAESHALRCKHHKHDARPPKRVKIANVKIPRRAAHRNHTYFSFARVGRQGVFSSFYFHLKIPHSTSKTPFFFFLFFALSCTARGTTGKNRKTQFSAHSAEKRIERFVLCTPLPYWVYRLHTRTTSIKCIHKEHLHWFPVLGLVEGQWR